MERNPIESIIAAKLIKKSLTVHWFQKLAAKLTIVLRGRTMYWINSIQFFHTFKYFLLSAFRFLILEKFQYFIKILSLFTIKTSTQILNAKCLCLKVWKLDKRVHLQHKLDIINAFRPSPLVFVSNVYIFCECLIIIIYNH